MMRWVLYAVIGLGGLVAVVALVGVMLPKGHQASRTATYTASPEIVFGVIADVEHYPDWRAVSKVELLPDDGQGKRFREHGDNGVITYRIETSDKPVTMRVRIADTSLAFGGTWTYQLSPAPGGGTSLKITEDGEVYNPIFRFMSKFFFSPTATIEKVQAGLARKLGEPAP